MDGLSTGVAYLIAGLLFLPLAVWALIWTPTWNRYPKLCALVVSADIFFLSMATVAFR